MENPLDIPTIEYAEAQLKRYQELWLAGKIDTKYRDERQAYYCSVIEYWKMQSS